MMFLSVFNEGFSFNSRTREGATICQPFSISLVRFNSRTREGATYSPVCNTIGEVFQFTHP